MGRYLLSDVLVGHVAGPGLGDETGPLSFGAAAVWLVLVLGQTGEEEPVWEEALPRQHDAAAPDTISLKAPVIIWYLTSTFHQMFCESPELLK